MRAALTRRSRASVSERPASDDHATSPERWLAGNCGKQAIGEEIADACGPDQHEGGRRRGDQEGSTMNRRVLPGEKTYAGRRSPNYPQSDVIFEA